MLGLILKNMDQGKRGQLPIKILSEAEVTLTIHFSGDQVIPGTKVKIHEQDDQYCYVFVLKVGAFLDRGYEI